MMRGTMDEILHYFDVSIEHYFECKTRHDTTEWCFLYVDGHPFLACSDDA